MKKTFLVFIVGLGLIACGDNSNTNGTGGTLDSNVTAPTDNTIDNSTMPDTSTMSNGAANDSVNLRGAGTGSGQSGAATDQSGGASTNSANSGSATDDTRGNK